VKLLSFTVAFAVMVVLFGRAWDHELARAQEPPIMLEQPGMRWQGRTAQWWAKRAVQARKDANARGRTIVRLRRELHSREIGPTLAIRLVFGNYADQALHVSWCESRWDTGATNGQFLGLFQMGTFARSRYGHSGSALGQAQAAYQYFVDSGRDWSPWGCKP
jgi:hypothetical protein